MRDGRLPPQKLLRRDALFAPRLDDDRGLPRDLFMRLPGAENRPIEKGEHFPRGQDSPVSDREAEPEGDRLLEFGQPCRPLG